MRWRWRAIPAPPGFTLPSLESAFNGDVRQSAERIGLTPLTMFVALEDRTRVARGWHDSGVVIHASAHEPKVLSSSTVGSAMPTCRMALSRA